MTGSNGSPLIRLLARHPLPYLGLVGLWTSLRTTVLVAGLLLQAVFDRLSGAAPVGWTVWTLIVVLAATEAARIFLWYGVVLSRVEPTYTATVGAGLRSNVLDSLLRRPAAVAVDRPVGDLISRFDGDAEDLRVFAIWSASNVSRLLIATAAVGIMVSISLSITAALVVPVILVLLAARRLTAVAGRYRMLSRQAADRVSSVISEAFGEVRAIKVARAETRMVDRLRVANRARGVLAVREDVLGAVQTSIFRATVVFGTGLVLLAASASLRAGSFTVGDLALFLFYIQFVTEAVTALGAMLVRFRRAYQSLTRLAEVSGGMAEVVRRRPTYLDGVAPPSVLQPPGENGTRLHRLTATGIGYHHPSTERGVRKVDLDMCAGTVTVLVGRVGAGKTTAIKALLGLVPAEDGAVAWNGRTVTARAQELVPPRVAYVPQVPRLFSGSLRENILLGEERTADQLTAAVWRAAFEADLAGFDRALDTVVGPRGLRLSGGQIQRVAAARALIRDPDLLVLDDLSNALDADTERVLWQRLLGEGRTVLAISHHPELLTRADHIVVLAGGAVVGAGTLSSLLRDCAEMRDLWSARK